MSALGQKRTLGHLRAMSALPPKADIAPFNYEYTPTPGESRWSRSADIAAVLALQLRQFNGGHRASNLGPRGFRSRWGRGVFDGRFRGTLLAEECAMSPKIARVIIVGLNENERHQLDNKTRELSASQRRELAIRVASMRHARTSIRSGRRVEEYRHHLHWPRR